MGALQTPVQQQHTELNSMQVIAKHQTSAPVNVIAIAEELGLKVWGMNSLPQNISGKIFRDPDNGGASGFSVAVNSSEAPVRQRFTIAHEIGHFILHRNLLETKGALVDDTLYRSGLSNAEEVAANKMAAHILMPFSLISTLVASGINDVADLAAQLQVSKTAMAIRLGLPT